MKTVKLVELEPGDRVLMETAFRGAVVMTVMFKDRTLRYCITDGDGRKCRSLGRQGDGSIKFVYADEENLPEKHWEVMLTADGMSACFNEDDDHAFNLLEKGDDGYSTLNKWGIKMFNRMFSAVFGEEE